MTKKIFIIAGEASGDNLGAKLIFALQQNTKEEIIFSGIGGEKILATGMKSLFPMDELSLIGFFEIIPHLPNLFNRIKQTVDEILRIKPDLVVTIDSPGFNFRVAKALKEHNEYKGKMLHYVAPTVWAYKPERAEKIAKLYDHLLLLLPFEPPYFEKVGLPCTFVGHPIMENALSEDGAQFRSNHSIPENEPLLAIMPGSRKGELKRLLPVFKETVSILRKDILNLHVVFLATPNFHKKLLEESNRWPHKEGIKTVVVSGNAEKQNAIAASTFALAKSGTGTLEIARANVSMVVTYKVHPISAWMLRRTIMIDFVNLINIIHNEEIIPELLQEDCTSEKLAAKLKEIFYDESLREEQLSKTGLALKMMGLGQEIKPSDKAAKAVLELL